MLVDSEQKLRVYPDYALRNRIFISKMHSAVS